MAVHGRRVCGRGVVSVCVWWSCRGVLAVSVVCLAVAVAHAVAVSCRVVPWRGVAVASAVFSLPSYGCDTPMDASVCNGLCGVCVVSICYLTG